MTAEVGGAFAPFLDNQVRKARAMLKGPLAEFSVAIVGNRRMAELHDRFMRIPGPTDVLTFELERDRRGRVTSGEVVICLPVARQKAKELRHEVRIELLLYAIHGMLHLCGFDDKDEKDYRKMHAGEDRILTALGFGPVFAAEALVVQKTRPAIRGRAAEPVPPGGRTCS
ncbi:MAG: rRNA maturation RNase YbeY [Tepidisphaeraceae bacterium]